MRKHMTIKTNILLLPVGHPFPDLPIDFSRDRLAEYLEVLDGAPLGESTQHVPPEAAATFALGALLGQFELPAGTVHVSQEARVVTPQPIGAPTTCVASITQRSRRRHATIVSLVFALVSPPDTDTCTIEGSSTVLVPNPD